MPPKDLEAKEYYSILALPRGAELDHIQQQYRSLALKYHPDQNQDAGASAQFLALAEAYDVLSTPKWRAIYDQFGVNGLTKGAPKGLHEFTESYAFHGDAHKVFKDFFGTDNPFQDLFMPIDEFHVGLQAGERTRLKQEAPILHNLGVTLEEVYAGCIKKLKLSRSVLNDDGHTTTERTKMYTVQVKRGWKEGTKITFPLDGSQGPNHIPADVVFVLQYKPHDRFKREGNNLVHVVNISLSDALTGCFVHITTLDGRQLTIPVSDVVHPSYELSVPNEGMPLTNEAGKFGDLVLRFHVVFPKTLSIAKKQMIKDALA
eukprot:m.239885 g.239885  ORF g.239885 m.239885 type:complete len:317 (-) comp54388_c0_seq2:161-1111(-)